MNRVNLSLIEKLGVLFTGPFTFFGLVFTIIGLFFLAGMDGLNGSAIVFEILNPLETNGKVVETGETNTTLNKKRVRYVDYVFSVDNHLDTATYSTTNYDLQTGDEITVQYLPEFFMISRIKGVEIQNENYILLLMMVLFPSIGIYMVFRDYKRLKRVIFILRNFGLAKAILKEKVITNTQINNRSLHKIIYQYHPGNTTLTYTFKTIKPNRFGETELLAYAEATPSKSVILKRLPDSVAKKILACGK